MFGFQELPNSVNLCLILQLPSILFWKLACVISPCSKEVGLFGGFKVKYWYVNVQRYDYCFTNEKVLLFIKFVYSLS